MAKLGEHTAAIQRFKWVEDETQPLTVTSSGQTHQQSAQLFAMSLVLQARSQRLQSKFDIAEDCLKRASGMLDSLTPLTRHQVRASSHIELAELQEAKGNLANADDLLKTVSDDYQSAAELVDGPEQARMHSDLAQNHVRRGRVSARSNRARAESELRSGIKIWGTLYVEHPDHPHYLDGLAAANIELANLLRLTSPVAVSAYRDCISAYTTLIAARPEIPLYAFNLSVAEIDLAYVLQTLGQASDAEEVGSQAVARLVMLAREYPEEIQYLSSAAVGDTIVAASLRDRGDFEGAENRLVPALKAHQRCVDEVAEVPAYRERLATTLSGIGQLKIEQGDLETAREHFERALTIFEELMNSDETVLSYRDAAASIHLQLADLLWKRGNETVARPHYEQSIKLREKMGTATSSYSFQFAWLLTQCEADEFRNLTQAADLLRKIDYIAARPSPAVLLAYVEAVQGNLATAQMALAKTSQSTVDVAEVDWVRALIEKPRDPQASADSFAVGDAKWKSTIGSHANLRRLRAQIEAALK